MTAAVSIPLLLVFRYRSLVLQDLCFSLPLWDYVSKISSHEDQSDQVVPSCRSKGYYNYVIVFELVAEIIILIFYFAALVDRLKNLEVRIGNNTNIARNAICAHYTGSKF